MAQNAEQQRLEEDRVGKTNWRRWGPYLSERQWGTVREDYSEHGSAWDYFSHDHARSRAYRWGEDGLLGISDEQQLLCFGLALWNGKDPILKERLFGLTGPEGNHGEDVKELYYYLDATPTGSYLKGLYKYPQVSFPYATLVEENHRRTKSDSEFEILDTGVFEGNRYFDLFIEYAKTGADDLLIQITAHNRGPEPAPLHLIPQIWFRNTWSWDVGMSRPHISAGEHSLDICHKELGECHLYFEDAPELLFTENDTNAEKLFGAPAAGGCYKDAFHEYVIGHNVDAINPQRRGTKAALNYALQIPARGQVSIRLRLCKGTIADPFKRFDVLFRQRISEADNFYRLIQHNVRGVDEKLVQRQAFAGMIWSKQFYHFDIPRWLDSDPAQPAPPERRKEGRNREWAHLNNADIISMPDKWEYPWYAAWDLAFHCIPLAMIDPEFAKNQLLLLTREWYMHPNGQLPAYEWAFGDVNPPVHAWATWKVYQIDRQHNGGRGDRALLERIFHKLLLNFTWWVNRKDAEGRNIFQGGFLGLDNIGVFDRSAPLPTGGHISQADGTSWMAMYCLNLMRIALELAPGNSVYEDLATKFFEHFLYIAAAMTNVGGVGIDLWDKTDEFFYDCLCVDGRAPLPLKVRSIVGLIPLFAVEVLDEELLEKVPQFTKRLEWFLNYRPDLASLVSRWSEPGKGETRLLSLLRGHRMKCLLRRMLDEAEFLSDYGIRALSKHHERDPYIFDAAGMRFTVNYQPGESDSGLFGGNSNWRGPIWFPVNYLLIESLRQFHKYYGDDFQVEHPTGSGSFRTLNEIADDLSARLSKIFLKDESGNRPFAGQAASFRARSDDLILFHEYFHGDTGRGVGASHQTGWTGLIAALLSDMSAPTQVVSQPKSITRIESTVHA
jgi:hypothetical protein